ncbi:SMI1/KNR4 family protein [Serratia rubidaea]|uniref:SMI1/KNR4 family protein n=1 Tax=Serratia rubidaea TaxID=61652 RepID=UPI002349560F|nr:SMI1/KNR4 family protein [Serratia rubidaea]MDC6110280.1 SMI1/KNR4 family protein [Serratia rubidaea]
MKEIDDLINKLSSTKKHEVMWLGAADKEQISRLEHYLSLKLPEDFKYFLEKTGGGGVIEQEISGIEDNDALADFGGTVYYDTIYCRSEYQLPSDLAVIYFKDDEICWCIDTSPNNFGEIVSYDLFSMNKNKKLHSSFKSFLQEYVNLRC